MSDAYDEIVSELESHARKGANARCADIAKLLRLPGDRGSPGTHAPGAAFPEHQKRG